MALNDPTVRQIFQDISYYTELDSSAPISQDGAEALLKQFFNVDDHEITTLVNIPHALEEELDGDNHKFKNENARVFFSDALQVAIANLYTGNLDYFNASIEPDTTLGYATLKENSAADLLYKLVLQVIAQTNSHNLTPQKIVDGILRTTVSKMRRFNYEEITVGLNEAANALKTNQADSNLRDLFIDALHEVAEMFPEPT